MFKKSVSKMIFFIACLLFIVSTVLETAVVNKYIRKAEEYERMARSMATLSGNTFVHLIKKAKITH
jgi:hypothetical protein